jgi:hypothetical protein
VSIQIRRNSPEDNKILKKLVRWIKDRNKIFMKENSINLQNWRIDKANKLVYQSNP